jgi:hypothetical protein
MEKTGNTAKLSYDFNTSGVCEVCIKGNWYRTTAREFRSFDGDRRITEPTLQLATKTSGPQTTMHTYQYDGPVYMLHTNVQVSKTYLQTIVTNNNTTQTKKAILTSSRI